jgi:hypothetical protein
MNSNKHNNVYQNTADENEKASYQKQAINKEKCESSQELSINEDTQSESKKGRIWIYFNQ